MAQHHWLSQRAQNLQTVEMDGTPFEDETMRRVNVFTRYQAHHDRLFQRALKDLLTLRAERRKAEIWHARQSGAALGGQTGICQASASALPHEKNGFVSQQAREAKEARSQAAEIRRENGEKRRQEHHHKTMQLQNARIEHQNLRNRKLASEVLSANGAESPAGMDLLAA
jgi:hypothetical protein